MNAKQIIAESLKTKNPAVNAVVDSAMVNAVDTCDEIERNEKMIAEFVGVHGKTYSRDDAIEYYFHGSLRSALEAAEYAHQFERRELKAASRWIERRVGNF